MSIQQKTLKALHLDERGAMMLMSVFMATIAVAMLYYVAAVGESVAYRERLQDGADATTYIGAAVMARSMNVVVIMNLAIASIFAASVIANAVFYIMIAAQAAADAACAASWGTCVNCCIAAVCLIGDVCEASGDRGDVDDEVEDGVEAANDVQNFLRTNARFIAVAASAEMAAGFGDPVPTVGGVALGGNLPFELRQDRNRMCEKTMGDGFITPQKTAIAGLALLQAVEIACNQGKAYTVAGLVTAAALGPICRQAHGRVDPEQALLTADLGSREFQFFGGVRGTDPPVDANDERVGVARWGATGSTMTDDLGLRAIAQIAIAQAEYYHGSRESRPEQTWSVQWRARLRRFNVSQAGGPICGGFFSGVCGALGSAVVH